mgnify:CR=1 FL=1
MPPLCHRGGADPRCHPVLRAILGSPKGCKHRVPPLCHHRAVNATCHPCATKEVIPAPIFPPTAQLCLQGYAGSGCHPHATPVPCWISSSTHFPPYNPAMLPSALPSFPPSLRYAVLHITTARSTHHPLQLRGGKLLLNKTKEQLYFSRTFNNLPQPAARQQFPIRRARRMERSGFVGTEGGICRALHEGKNNIAVRCWCCN